MNFLSKYICKYFQIFTNLMVPSLNNWFKLQVSIKPEQLELVSVKRFIFAALMNVFFVEFNFTVPKNCWVFIGDFFFFFHLRYFREMLTYYRIDAAHFSSDLDILNPTELWNVKILKLKVTIIYLSFSPFTFPLNISIFRS